MEESTKQNIDTIKNVIGAMFPGRNFYAVLAVSDEDTHESQTCELTVGSCSSCAEDAQSSYEMSHLITAVHDITKKHMEEANKNLQASVDSEELMNKHGKMDGNYLRTYKYDT